VETAIGVFGSRDRAEEALKELLRQGVPEDSVVFLTRSKSDAETLGKEIGTIAGGFTGGAVGLGAGMVAASLSLIPGIGQVFAVGVGAAALLGFLGTKTGATVGEGLAKETEIPAPVQDEKSSEDAQLFVDVLKTGKSLIVVRTESLAIAKTAAAILDRATPSAQAPSAGKMQTVIRHASLDVTVVEIKGRIVVGEGNTMLRQTVQELIEVGRVKVLLAMQEVEHIDSSGIGELVRAHTAVRKANGQLKIASPSPKVQEMLQMTMLHKVLDVHPDEATAVKSFRGPSASAATT
jgi:anti-sigma B factor antagonist